MTQTTTQPSPAAMRAAKRIDILLASEAFDENVARIIDECTAAPELLAACEQALRHIQVDETTHGRTFAAGNVLRAAIAKAEAR